MSGLSISNERFGRVPRSVALAALLLAASLCVADDPAEKPKAPSLKLNGRPLRGLEPIETAREGSPLRLWLARAADVPLLLDDAPGVVHLSTARLRDEGIVETTEPDGQRRPIGARVSLVYAGPGEWRTINPLAAMSDEELHGLRGVFIEDWLPELAEPLAKLDLERCAIAIERPMNPGADGLATLRLPRATHYLECRQRSWVPGERPWLAFVGELRELRRFKADLAAAFDCALLADAADLEGLDLSDQVLDNPEAIGALRNLRSLDLSDAKGVGELSFLRGLDQLRSLDARGLAPVDWAPVAGLPGLETLTVDGAAAGELLDAPPLGLRRLFLAGEMEEDELAEWRTRLPACEVAPAPRDDSAAPRRNALPWE
jgi:hypothetical protein